MRQAVTRFAARLGKQPLLIQGAGGNVSWKEDGALWVKASGIWLSEAEEKDIFVGLDHAHVQRLAANGAGDFTPAMLAGQRLRSSIETALHALMPQKIVVHCHAVDVIVHTLIAAGQERLAKLLDGLAWAWVDYVKPGPQLAAAVRDAIERRGVAPDVLVLDRHGLVVAGESVEAVDALLRGVMRRTAIAVGHPPLNEVAPQTAAAWRAAGYRPSGVGVVQRLATIPDALARVRNDWVLYPDHAVFLDPVATIYDDSDTPENFTRAAGKPVCIVVPGVDVMISETAMPGQRAMIECYGEVVRRLPGEGRVIGLDDAQVAELIDWDAEKYRQLVNA
jgi:rhamnose utilization protein RhaD (predicted bifunctional aldolase and dehydrogenase)